VKKIVALATLRAQPTWILPLQLTDTTISIADTGIPDNKLTSSATGVEDSHPNASATITITMTPVSLPEE